MGNADGRLAQDQVQVGGTALGTDFADGAEGQYVKGLAFIVEVIHHQARIEFAQDQAFLTPVAARGMRVVRLWGGHRVRCRYRHWTGSMSCSKREARNSS
jgi:hypothetical protein